MQAQQNIVQQRLREYDHQQWLNKINTAHQKRGNVWREIKTAKHSSSLDVPPLINRNAQKPTIKVCGPEQKAELLADFFANNHINNIQNQDAHTQNIVQENVWLLEEAGPELNTIIQTTPSRVSRFIRARRPYKAPGNDGVQNIMLKKLPRTAIVQLFYFFTYRDTALL